MSRILYMPSTPLNVLVCAALANARRETDVAELWLIDQKKLGDNLYVQALNAWQETPFKHIKILPGLAKGRAKLQERHDNFTRIQQGLNAFHPDVIAVGSDRRIEFQFAMHKVKKQANNVQGWYLDDGLYSYAGRPHHLIKDGINALLKKLSYGFWWQEPKTIGASNWIHQAWLFQPQQAVSAIQKKQMHKLDSTLFAAPEVQSFSQCVLEVFDYNGSALKNLNVIMIFPHPNDMARMKGYGERVTNFVKQLIHWGYKVGIKYHPRQQEHDVLALAELGEVEIIPANLAFEFVLPFLTPDTYVIADVCTVLMTAKWLRDDINSVGVLDENDAYQQTFVNVLNKLEIPLYKSFNDFLPQLLRKIDG